MAFSNEWEEVYKTGTHNSVWPWSEVISLFYHYFPDKKDVKVLELGCGAGANIPFFCSIGAKYYGIEGSKTKACQLSEIYADDKNVNIYFGDFSECFPVKDSIDLVLDRSSVTHNSTDDISRVFEMSFQKLALGGYYFGLDWFSNQKGAYGQETEEYMVVDSNTKVFSTGYFAGLGNVHFSDEEHIRRLLINAGFSIVELYEKTEIWREPCYKKIARWNFVAQKVVK